MYRFILYCLAAALFSGIAPGVGIAADKHLVFVTIPPQKYFVEQIGRELVDVQVMVEPGADPHIYEPSPQQMAALAKADLYFAVGVEFEEARLEKLLETGKNIPVIHTDRNIKKLAMKGHHHDSHHSVSHRGDDADHDRHNHSSHGREQKHKAEAGLDPHIWLSPPLVKIQAETILKALQEVDPAHRENYLKNYQDFIIRIDRLDAKLKEIFSHSQGMQFIVFHPAWGYFADAYGLVQIPVEVEGKSPKPAQLIKLIEKARELGCRIIFVQPQFSAKSANVVAREIGGQVAFADPLAEDWMDNLYRVAEKFEKALQ